MTQKVLAASSISLPKKMAPRDIRSGLTVDTVRWLVPRLVLMELLQRENLGWPCLAFLDTKKTRSRDITRRKTLFQITIPSFKMRSTPDMHRWETAALT